MLEELNYTSVMKPVFSPDRLATTDLTHTIIGASNLTNSVLASDLCRQALQEKRMEIQVSPRSVEVKCSDVLHCQLGKVTGSPSFSCGSPLPPPVPPRSGGAACPLRVSPPCPARPPRPPGPAAGTETTACSAAPRAPPRPLALSRFRVGLGDVPKGKGRRRVTRLTERSCDGDGGM